MSAKRKLSCAEEFLRNSRNLRAKLESLLKSVEELAAEPCDDAVSAGAVLETEADEWNRLTEQVRTSFERHARDASSRRRRVSEELVDRLRRALTNSGRTVFGEGSLLIVDGVIHVDLDLKNARMRINGILHGDLSLSGMQKAIAEEATWIAENATQTEQFFRHLLQSYKIAISASGQPFGSQVMTADLIPPLVLLRQSPRFLADPDVSTFNGYPLRLFRADLFKLLNSKQPEIKGTRFHSASGSTTKGAVFMLVPSLGRPSHVGRIWFENAVENV